MNFECSAHNRDWNRESLMCPCQIYRTNIFFFYFIRIKVYKFCWVAEALPELLNILKSLAIVLTWWKWNDIFKWNHSCFWNGAFAPFLVRYPFFFVTLVLCHFAAGKTNKFETKKKFVSSNWNILCLFTIFQNRSVWIEIVIHFIWITNENLVETWLRMSFPKKRFQNENTVRRLLF